MLQNLDVIEQKTLIFTVLTIILYYRYYDTEDFSSISIIVMLNIMIYDNIVILPSSKLYYQWLCRRPQTSTSLFEIFFSDN